MATVLFMKIVNKQLSRPLINDFFKILSKVACVSKCDVALGQYCKGG